MLIINPLYCKAMYNTTIFKRFNNPVEEKPLTDVFNDIKCGLYANQINAIRELIHKGLDDEAKKQKQKLLAFTVSCTFSDGITLSKVKHYNSLVVLDIDKLSLETIDNVKTICISDVHTFACFKSPSNRGLKVIVKSDSNLQNHTNTFNEIKNYYETLIGIGVDPSGSNFNRLCFYSYDPDIYVHLDSQIFISKVNMITNDVSKIVELIVANQTDITNDYKDWLTVGFALADYCGESGREFYHRISSINSQYDYSECNNQYNNCLKSKGTGITIKSLFYLAKSNGIDISSIRSFSLNDIVKESVNAQSKSIKSEKIKKNNIV